MDEPKPPVKARGDPPATELDRVPGPGRHPFAALGRPASAARRAWETVRPRSRRGAILGLLAVMAGSVVLAGVFLVGAAMAWSPYIQTDLHPDANPRAWAALAPKFGGEALCATCHEVESTRLASAQHRGIGCESCHGALRDHALSSPEALAAAAVPVIPTDTVCKTCHVSALGRPAGVNQINLTDHYVPLCLQCHDPHTAVANRPPVVLHPLENLPPCVTCHGPDGFKARSQRHPDVSDDERCLDCHAPGRGPDGST
jgi:hypothetical protein